jgi:hypothetical protein
MGVRVDGSPQQVSKEMAWQAARDHLPATFVLERINEFRNPSGRDFVEPENVIDIHEDKSS